MRICTDVNKLLDLRIMHPRPYRQAPRSRSRVLSITSEILLTLPLSVSLTAPIPVAVPHCQITFNHSRFSKFSRSEIARSVLYFAGLLSLVTDSHLCVTWTNSSCFELSHPPLRIQPITYWCATRLFPVWSCYKQNCYKYCCGHMLSFSVLFI